MQGDQIDPGRLHVRDLMDVIVLGRADVVRRHGLGLDRTDQTRRGRDKANLGAMPLNDPERATHSSVVVDGGAVSRMPTEGEKLKPLRAGDCVPSVSVGSEDAPRSDVLAGDI